MKAFYSSGGNWSLQTLNLEIQVSPSPVVATPQKELIIIPKEKGKEKLKKKFATKSPLDSPSNESSSSNLSEITTVSTPEVISSPPIAPIQNIRNNISQRMLEKLKKKLNLDKRSQRKLYFDLIQEKINLSIDLEEYQKIITNLNNENAALFQLKLQRENELNEFKTTNMKMIATLKGVQQELIETKKKYQNMHTQFLILSKAEKKLAADNASGSNDLGTQLLCVICQGSRKFFHFFWFSFEIFLIFFSKKKDKQKTILFSPCLHVCCCEQCANFGEVKNCPMCRAEIKQRTKVFL